MHCHRSEKVCRWARWPLRVDALLRDLDARAQGLAEMGQALEEGAEQVVFHAGEGDDALELVRSLLAQHRDWKAVEGATAAVKASGARGSRQAAAGAATGGEGGQMPRASVK